jgi:hypothetical protein
MKLGYKQRRILAIGTSKEGVSKQVIGQMYKYDAEFQTENLIFCGLLIRIKGEENLFTTKSGKEYLERNNG